VEPPPDRGCVEAQAAALNDICNRGSEVLLAKLPPAR